jgi:hypothetical protein
MGCITSNSFDKAIYLFNKTLIPILEIGGLKHAYDPNEGAWYFDTKSNKSKRSVNDDVLYELKLTDKITMILPE